MKHIKNFILFEKTSLINIGVPFSIMKQIQKDFAISDDAQWKNLNYKKDITLALHKPKNTLIVSVSKTNIFILFSYNNVYYIETYTLTGNDDFGNKQWQKVNREISTITEIVQKIGRGYKSYELISGTWLHEFSKVRKIRKEESNFDNITNNFKKNFAENFTRIVKKIYGRKAGIITDIIINHLKNVKNNLTDQQIRDILFLNVERAKETDILKNKQKEKDPYKLYNEFIKANSLTIFDEHLLNFENDYSEKYKEYLNVPIMIEKFGLDKVNTAFMYFLYSNKLMKL